jgi:hypothetical protein
MGKITICKLADKKTLDFFLYSEQTLFLAERVFENLIGTARNNF